LHFVEPGRPTQNTYIERFNGKFRDKCSNANHFPSLNNARATIESWSIAYNENGPTRASDIALPKNSSSRS
jgi:putative transposase